MIRIRKYDGALRAEVEINEGSKFKYELMKEHFISLKFALYTPIGLKVGDYIDFRENAASGEVSYADEYPYITGSAINLGRFELISDYTPTFNTSTGAYEYDVKFEAHYYKFKNKIFRLLTDVFGQESSWALTDTPSEFLALAVANMNKIEGSNKYSVGGVASELSNVRISCSFSSSSIIDGLSAIAQACDPDNGYYEWWFEDYALHLGKRAVGTAYDLEMGVNVESMTSTEGQRDKCTKVFAFGSDRNITNRYRKHVPYTFDTYSSSDGTTQAGDASDKARLKEIAIACGKRYAFYDSKHIVTPSMFKEEYKTYPSATQYTLTRKADSGTMTTGDDGTFACIQEYELNCAETLNAGYIDIEFANDDLNIKFDKLYADDECKVVIEICLKTLRRNVLHYVYLPLSVDSSGVWSAKIDNSAFQRIWLSQSAQSLMLRLRYEYKPGGIPGSVKYTTTNDMMSYKIIGKNAKVQTTIGGASVMMNANMNTNDLARVFVSDTLPTTANDIAGLRISKIPYAWFVSDYMTEETYLKGSVANNLMLPNFACQVVVNGETYNYNNEGYVMLDKNMPTAEQIEKVVVFDKIYPSMNDVIGSDLTMTSEAELDEDGNETGVILYYYTFKTSKIKNISASDFDDDTLKIAFAAFDRYNATTGKWEKAGNNGGKCNGMEFELKLESSNSQGTTFKIIPNTEYSVSTPNAILYPQVGDGYNIIGLDTSYYEDGGQYETGASTLLKDAEVRVLEQAVAYLQRAQKDTNTYTCKMMSDDIFDMLMDDVPTFPGVGDNVVLKNTALFGANGRASRVIGIEFCLDLPYDSPSLIVGDTSAYSRFGALEEKVNALNIVSAGNSGSTTSNKAKSKSSIGSSSTTTIENAFDMSKWFTRENVGTDDEPDYVIKPINDLSIGSARMSYDGSNSALKVAGNMYASGGVSAFGVGSVSGGGSANVDGVDEVYIGETEPTDSNIELWVNPNVSDSDMFGASIDNNGNLILSVPNIDATIKAKRGNSWLNMVGGSSSGGGNGSSVEISNLLTTGTPIATIKVDNDEYTIKAPSGNNNLELGETETTAYRGDRGKQAYEHSLITNGNPHGITASMLGIDTSKFVQKIGDEMSGVLKITSLDDNVSNIEVGKGGIKIGSYLLQETNNGIRISKIDGTDANLYATGGISAFGFNGGSGSLSAGVSSIDGYDGAVTLKKIKIGTTEYSLVGDGKIVIPNGGASSWNDLSDKPTSLAGYGLSTEVNTLVANECQGMLTESNYANYITASAIGAAKSTHDHVWADITDRPSKLSAFTNDLGLGALAYEGVDTESLTKYVKKAGDDVVWLQIGGTNGVKLSYENGALKIDGNVYATGGISAYGAGSTSGGGIGNSVSISDLLSTGTTIAKITIDGTEHVIKAPTGGGNYSEGDYISISGNAISVNLASLKSALNYNSIITTDTIDQAVSGCSAQSITTALGYTPLKSSDISGLLSESDAESTYLSISDASGTYLTKTDAGNTYLSQKNAAETYLKKAGDTMTGTLGMNGCNIYFKSNYYGLRYKASDDEDMTLFHANFNGDDKYIMVGMANGYSENNPNVYLRAKDVIDFRMSVTGAACTPLTIRHDWKGVSGFSVNVRGEGDNDGKLRIGNGILTWDEEHKAFYMYNAVTGVGCNLYATGGISAYGVLDSTAMDNLVIANGLTAKTIAIGNTDANVALSYNGTYGMQTTKGYFTTALYIGSIGSYGILNSAGYSTSKNVKANTSGGTTYALYIGSSSDANYKIQKIYMSDGKLNVMINGQTYKFTPDA